MSEPAGSSTQMPKLPLPDIDPSDWADLDDWKIKAFAALVIFAVLLWLYRKVRRAMRRRGPATLHPKLQRYGGRNTALSSQRRAEAEKILTTSSTTTIAGYEIVKQLEAVYVDGFRLAEDALEGLKATASMKGANALTSVQCERGPGGKYSASGDAVVVKSSGSEPDTQPTDPPDVEGPVDDAENPQIGGDCWPVEKGADESTGPDEPSESA